MAATTQKSTDIGAALRFAYTWFARRPLMLLVIAIPGSLFGVATLLLSRRDDLAALSVLASIASAFVVEITAAALTYAVFVAYEPPGESRVRLRTRL